MSSKKVYVICKLLPKILNMCNKKKIVWGKGHLMSIQPAFNEVYIQWHYEIFIDSKFMYVFERYNSYIYIYMLCLI